ncbi:MULTISPECIES: elongation factor P 5-aminopentanone reductase [Sporosarcina]|uniref:elongation factor P 5-aminopentanone reductase n=1 Tax=Sporosarcina TaxID=1569 RepID=UPI00058BEBCB|nr:MULTISPECIES: SDR family oxidoreductase [Sporosarcina]WJY28675.1 SDR family oxidoreductase [Sporosarcina sp. 0.2-SM1T-5]
MTRRRALILGASGGIGQAICRRLAADGWSLCMQYNTNGSAAADLRDSLQQEHPDGEFVCMQADFTAKGAADALATAAGDISCIVAAGGQSALKLLTETTEDEMEALWRVHVQNPARLISLLSSKLRKHAPAYVVFIGSIWGSAGAAGEVMYSSVKGAQHAFVKAYAKEAAFGGIRVNGIAPGWIETRMNEEIPDEERALVMQEIPLQIPGRPEEVADLVGFLTSGKADYMTGEILKLNGGWYI